MSQIERGRLLDEMFKASTIAGIVEAVKEYRASLENTCAGSLTNDELKDLLQMRADGVTIEATENEAQCERCGRMAVREWLDQCEQVSQRHPVPGYCERCLQRIKESGE